MAQHDADSAQEKGGSRPGRWFGRRRMISPLIVMLVAVVIVWWASERDEQARRMMHREVTQLVVAAARGEELSGRVRADAMIEPAVRRAISAIGGHVADDLNRLGVEVRDGEVDHAAGPDASHHAVVSVDEQPVLGLRLATDGDDRMVILGFWTPEDGRTDGSAGRRGG